MVGFAAPALKHMHKFYTQPTHLLLVMVVWFYCAALHIQELDRHGLRHQEQHQADTQKPSHLHAVIDDLARQLQSWCKQGRC
jgi:hypothetical protein